MYPARPADASTWAGASVLAGTSTFAEHWCVHAPTAPDAAPDALDSDDADEKSVADADEYAGEEEGEEEDDDDSEEEEGFVGASSDDDEEEAENDEGEGRGAMESLS